MTAKIGFLSVRQHAGHGYFGGYLIVNQIARPLEFHCTLPVKPSRAQALLYGPTLDEFICGEQIARALVTKAKLKPDLVITDSAAPLAMTLVSDVPAVKLAATPDSGEANERLKLPGTGGAELVELSAAGQSFSVRSDSKLTEQDIASVLDKLSTNFELAEPFRRVIEALLEAHPIAKAA